MINDEEWFCSCQTVSLFSDYHAWKSCTVLSTKLLWFRTEKNGSPIIKQTQSLLPTIILLHTSSAGNDTCCCCIAVLASLLNIVLETTHDLLHDEVSILTQSGIFWNYVLLLQHSPPPFMIIVQTTALSSLVIDYQNKYKYISYVTYACITT